MTERQKTLEQAQVFQQQLQTLRMKKVMFGGKEGGRVPMALPETRTMPTAPRPGAVAMATMGSEWRASMASRPQWGRCP